MPLAAGKLSASTASYGSSHRSSSEIWLRGIRRALARYTEQRPQEAVVEPEEKLPV